MSEYPTYLIHHGIKDQKWGIRRFQNEDGSLTPEGRERYGKGDSERVKIEKAKATYETQKYKANLKSKAQREKDKRAAAEERNRIKQQGKTNRLVKKEQAKLEQVGRSKNLKLRNTKNMSDEELYKSINRLKLQSEYNKQYALATHPDGALAKADRFFEGATGKAVTQVAAAAIPPVATAATKAFLEGKVKINLKSDNKDSSSDDKSSNKNQVKNVVNDNKNVSNNSNVSKQSSNPKNTAKAFKESTEVLKEAPKAVENAQKTVENVQKFYDYFDKTYSSNSSKSVSSIKTTSSTKNIPESVLVTPVTQIAGYLPEKSAITSARDTSLNEIIKKK